MSRDRILPKAGWVEGTLTACRWCGGAIPKGRRTFCSGARTRRRGRKILAVGTGCVHQHLLRSRPGYMRQHVRDRDHGVCAIGGLACGTHDWHADHIVPVCEGGGGCGLDNMRTLCVQHHKEVTKLLAARRAAARKAAKAAIHSGVPNEDQTVQRKAKDS